MSSPRWKSVCPTTERSSAPDPSSASTDPSMRASTEGHASHLRCTAASHDSSRARDWGKGEPRECADSAARELEVLSALMPNGLIALLWSHVQSEMGDSCLLWDAVLSDLVLRGWMRRCPILAGRGARRDRQRRGFERRDQSASKHERGRLGHTLQWDPSEPPSRWMHAADGVPAGDPV